MNIIKILLLVAIVAGLWLLHSCTPSSNPTQPLAPGKNYASVPNWQTDTLVSYWYDNGDKYDTAYTLVDSGKTCLIYASIKYELKAYKVLGGNVSDTPGNYFVDVFTMQGVQINTDINQNGFAITSKFWDYGFNLWRSQRQSLQVHFAPFPEKAGIYTGK